MTEYFNAMPDADQATPRSKGRDATTAGQTILIVDDDSQTQDVIRRYLEDYGFSVMAASSRTGIPRNLASINPSLVLLDLRLGQDDGLDILREIRSHSDVPVIVITDDSPDAADRVVALELGADAYVAKPVPLRELVALAKAVLRRQEMGRLRRGRDTERGAYKFAGWQLERRTRQLIDRSGDPVPLTKGQYTLLVTFLDAPRRALTREYLLQATRANDDVFDRSIDVQVNRLRRKLESDPSSPKMILTHRGIGYLFACDVERC
ncbi:response regulator [Bradyrhizobium sp. Ai1a-2]|uniref:response regulator n=1 Tax=Bradyrhizobium sp. Ai1a-2 TaxID=196490 RepID=UPI0003F93BDA|nr:response regulator [Bradyrhizobium sp. Ai1a-2]